MTEKQATFSVKVDPLKLDTLFAVLFISPALDRNVAHKKRVRWFWLVILGNAITTARLLLLSSVNPDSLVAYALGDFTKTYGKARDYCLIMGSLWSLASGGAVVFSLLAFSRGLFHWSGLYRLFQVAYHEFPSQQELTDFCSLYRSMKIIVDVKKVTHRISVVAYLAVRFGSLLIYRSLTYTLTFGLLYYPSELAAQWCTAAWSELGGMLYIHFCHYFMLKLDATMGKAKLFHQFCMKSCHRPSGLAFFREIAPEYYALQREIQQYNAFWKNTSGCCFIGMGMAVCFNLYLLLFVRLESFMRMPLFFWAFTTFVMAILIPLLFATKVREKIRRFYRLMNCNLLLCRVSARTHTKWEDLLLHSSSIEPFTCFDIFGYKHSVLLTLLLEISSNLLLLRSIKG